ncbi:transcriptional regulator [Acinetobacter baumannii]
MSKVSTELSASARNSITRVLRILANSNNSQIAEKLGLDPTTFSRFKNDKKNNSLSDIENVCAMLDLLELKIVPKKYKLIHKEKLAALLNLSKAYMGRLGSVDDLFQDDIEDFGINEELGY